MAAAARAERTWWSGVAAGTVSALGSHAVLAALLVSAISAGSGKTIEQEGPDLKGNRRAQFGESVFQERRGMHGLTWRTRGFLENSFDRRSVLELPGRRREVEEAVRPSRFIALTQGRRSAREMVGMEERPLDWGSMLDDQALVAMVIPRLGLKQYNPRELPRLTKYEQPERAEDGVNVSRDNLTPEDLLFKSFDHKDAQTDRRRKKPPTLSDLIDAPDDDDPRKRPSQLEDIVGVAEGSASGEGVVGQAGDVYLGKIEQAVRQAFKVPVFLSKEELRKLVVEIRIDRMDAEGHVVAYTVKRKSGSGGFDSAAVEAVKRFVPAEGGSRTLPPPSGEMLDLINRKGLLIRLEGKRLQ